MKIIHLNYSSWPDHASEIISRNISTCLHESRNNSTPSCNIFITGGNTVKGLYHSLGKNKILNGDNHINFYLTDERLPQNNHDNSVERNDETCYKYLLNNIKNKNINFQPIIKNNFDSNKIKCLYEKIIPNIIDIVILSLGADGHIASIFPHNLQTYENFFQFLMLTECENHKYQRLSITYKLLYQAKCIYIIAIGENKKSIFDKILVGDFENTSISKELALKATWITTFPS